MKKYKTYTHPNGTVLKYSVVTHSPEDLAVLDLEFLNEIFVKKDFVAAESVAATCSVAGASCATAFKVLPKLKIATIDKIANTFFILLFFKCSNCCCFIFFVLIHSV
jgi:hypothetical protein